MDTTFAIVGTAGRGTDKDRLSDNHFKAMCECGRLLLQQFKESEYGVDTLVSGGAAWADHTAVELFLKKEVPKLKLFLPCRFDAKNRQYDITPMSNRDNYNGKTTGEISNQYHQRFSRKCSLSSLSDIMLAMEQGADVIIGKGFYQRNSLVAQSDIILAMTFGDKEWLKEGGTAHTLQTYLNRVRKYGFFDKSFHYDLNCGELFCGARVKAESKPVVV
jgi:hypothetical protein